MNCPAIRIYSICVHCYPGEWHSCDHLGHGFRNAVGHDGEAQEAQAGALEVWIVTLGYRCDAGIAATLEHRADNKKSWLQHKLHVTQLLAARLR